MKRLGWKALVVSAAIVAGAAFAACSDDDDDPADPAGGISPAAETTAAETPAAETPAAAATSAEGGDDEGGDGVESLTITATDFAFEADASSVAPGSVVEVSFSNNGSAQHTVTFYTDDAYTDAIPGGDSDRVPAGQSLNFTFEAPDNGSVFYRCEVHPSQMEGELTVE
jgi:plastocyanin